MTRPAPACESLSVVLSTYQKPRDLELALASVLRADRPSSGEFEILVADDGSGPDTADVVARADQDAPFDVVHVWHEDKGFRLATIRNRAIRQARGEVIVFVDGDSLVADHALTLHSRRCRPLAAHVGSRCYLSQDESEQLRGESQLPERLLTELATRDRLHRRIRLAKNTFYRLTRLKQRPKFVAGNCAVHRQDLGRVNGFDERFVGWGLEDDDIARRLRRAGVRIHDGTLDCLVAHLFHLTHPSHRPTIHHTPNFRYYNRGGFLTRCRYGLRPRPLSEVAFAIVGELPPELAGLEAKLGRGDAPEVVIRGIGGERSAVPSAEVVIEVGELPRDRGVVGALGVLEGRV